MLVEGTGAQPWVDLVYGMTAPWWSFRDTSVRPHHPLISPERWTSLLEETGFEDSQVFVCEAAKQALILARVADIPGKPVVSAENWLVFADEHGVGSELSKLLSADGSDCTLPSGWSTTARGICCWPRDAASRPRLRNV